MPDGQGQAARGGGQEDPRRRSEYGDSTYFPPGWDRERLLTAPAHDFCGLPAHEFYKLREGMLEKMGREPYKTWVAKLSKLKIPSPPEVLWRHFGTDYSPANSSKDLTWGFVIFATRPCIEIDEAKFERVKQRVKELILSPLEPYLHEESIGLTKERFRIEWWEDEDLPDGTKPRGLDDYLEGYLTPPNEKDHFNAIDPPFRHLRCGLRLESAALQSVLADLKRNYEKPPKVPYPMTDVSCTLQRYIAPDQPKHTLLSLEWPRPKEEKQPEQQQQQQNPNKQKGKPHTHWQAKLQRQIETPHIQVVAPYDKPPLEAWQEANMGPPTYMRIGRREVYIPDPFEEWDYEYDDGPTHFRVALDSILAENGLFHRLAGAKPEVELVDLRAVGRGEIWDRLWTGMAVN
ncbi:hypothetical protein V8F06_012545 [Rhypophila decipiens]